MIPDLCIYHANCTDGFTAAWVIKRCCPNVELVPAAYGDEPPDVEGKHVLIVDFSYPRDVLNKMGSRARAIVVLDHHKTAQADLEYFASGHPLQLGDDLKDGDVLAVFDMDKSGARLAWEYCFPTTQVPVLVSYTEDRDLWRWALPESRAVNAAIGAFSQDLEQWDTLNEALRASIGRMDESILVFEGRAILLQRDKDMDAVIDTSWRWMVIGGYRVPVANAPFFFASDIGNRLAEGNAFAATYYDASSGERIFSLRSVDRGADVSEIAKRYGGGGHYHAAGFKMPKGWEGDQ